MLLEKIVKKVLYYILFDLEGLKTKNNEIDKIYNTPTLFNK